MYRLHALVQVPKESTPWTVISYGMIIHLHLEVAEFCLFNQNFGRKYVWSCGILSFPASGSPNRGRGIPVIVIETFHDGKPFPALKK